jgi:GH15 family glucan-1,4-alpha-glucosidase
MVEALSLARRARADNDELLVTRVRVPGAADHLPIAEHGLIGDQRSAALVATDGTIDWYCPDRFDAPSVFAAILDRAKGGHYRIASTDRNATTKQLYLPDTNVLITRFLSHDGVGELHDFMPLDSEHQQLIRRVVGIRGRVPFRAEVEPRFDYGRQPHLARRTHTGAVFTSRCDTLSLSTSVPLAVGDTGATAEFSVAEGESVCFVLCSNGDATSLDEHDGDRLLRKTIDRWRGWLARSTYSGRWRERVHRSALTLALLTYAPTGAMVAAPTTSLPELVGGSRNWDYRYVWARDFAFGQYALSKLGFTEEARRVNSFARTVPFDRSGQDSTPLSPLYRVDGSRDMTEETLDHLEGYRGSRPVRIGNGASRQLQLDLYGELLDSIYIYEQLARDGRGPFLSYAEWQKITLHIDWLCGHWDRPDEGIWEVRSGRRNFTFSRLMCWVAFDRSIRIATSRGLPADVPRWTAARDAVFTWVMEHGWNERRGAFVQHDETDMLDASLLLMPLVHFVAPTDPRWLSTLDAIGEELARDSLVYRYNPSASPDGIEGNEGTFSMCTFWYVECLARAGRIEEAQLVFEKMHTYANHVGLYSEQIGPTGELLGNFPQAFTHLALISAAIDLDRRLDNQRGTAS